MQHERQCGLQLQLPATSANLGPGFDAVGLALSLSLEIEAEAAPAFAIGATGRDAALCGAVPGNLIFETYRAVLTARGGTVQPLSLRLHNEIPLGMGCGSSAAALLAGVALANHFGDLGMEDAAIVSEASRLEGHPDNVAACWYGGFTVSAETESGVQTATFAGDPAWQLLLAMQPTSLATKTARGLLPESYPKTDAIWSVQRTALLVAAFAERRLDLLRAAMDDRLHQPYRGEACPLLGRLLPLARDARFAGIALSGAGPSVLMILAADADAGAVAGELAERLGPETELLPVCIAGGAVCR